MTTEACNTCGASLDAQGKCPTCPSIAETPPSAPAASADLESSTTEPAPPIVSEAVVKLKPAEAAVPDVAALPPQLAVSDQQPVNMPANGMEQEVRDDKRPAKGIQLGIQPVRTRPEGQVSPPSPEARQLADRVGYAASLQEPDTLADDEEIDPIEGTYTDGGPDPTAPFKLDELLDRHLFRFDEDLVTLWSHALREECISVFVSESRRIANSALAAVAQHGPFSPIQKRVLPINPNQGLAQPDKLTKIRLGDGGETLVLVVAEGENGKDFMSWVLRSYHALGYLTGELKRRRRFLAVSVTPEVLVEDAEERWEQLPCVHLPFLQTYLRAVEAPQLEDIVVQQKQAGLWGADQSFVTEIERFYRHGTLKSEIEVRQREYENQANKTFARPISVPALGDAHWLETTVLYTSTFFPDVALEDFQEILDVLLADRRLPPTSAPSTAPVVHSTPIAEGELLRDVWRARSNAILKACGLTIMPVSTGSANVRSTTRRCVQFADDRCRAAVAEEFATAHAFTHIDCVESLRRSGLLYKKRPLLADRLISYFASAANQEPARYDHRWLLDTLGYAAVAGRDMVSRGARPADVYGLLEELDRPAVAHAANRIAELVRAFQLSSGAFEETTEKFLGQLLTNRGYDFVVTIASKLHNLPRFESLFWLRRLLNEGDEQARRRAYRAIKNLFRDGAYARVVFKRLLDWLPALGADRIEPCARYAQLWFLNTFDHDAFNGSARDSASWPPADSLLGPLTSAYPDSAVAELAGDLAAWLLHPSLAALLCESIAPDGPKRWMLRLGRFVSEWLVPQKLGEQLGSGLNAILLDVHLGWALAMLEYNENEEEPKWVADLLVAMILAHWGALLLGLEASQTQARGIELHYELLRSLAGRLDRRRRRRVAAFLNTARESVRVCIQAVNSLAAPVGSEQRAARTAAKGLLNSMVKQITRTRDQLVADGPPQAGS